MTSWRSKDRRASRPNQPTIPGLFGSFATPKSLRKLNSPGDFSLHRAKARLGLVLIAFALFFLLVSGRLAILTLGQEPQETQLIQAASPDMAVTARADILDRNGTVIATSLPTILLMADTRKILDTHEAAEKLMTALPDLDPVKLMKDLESSRRYVTLRRHLTPRQYYAINTMGIAGLEFAPDESRIYPSGPTTSHVVGYTDIDNNGISGLEKSQNSKLQNQQAPLVTTLDIRLQTILHRELSNAITEFHALAATGIILDITTGEILSLVSLPDFDPQNAGSADDNTKFNRATLGVYEMGSTFKTFNTALALGSGLIKPSERFDTTHPIEIGNKTIRDFHAADHALNVAEIFMESSNIGSARMADKIGTARQQAFLASLGLTKKSTIELPEVGTPIVPSQASWRDTTTMTISFGHGIAVNTVQLAGAAASVLNDGLLVKPTLLKQTAEDQKNQPKMRILSSHASAQMRALMRLVVKHGTAKRAEVPGYLVGGKTG
ncbi:MAG: penicillin-binding protein 2, partial [Alphaproteobacteria bacterium]|nr:penicillin-binding protein 2 [Alphaproteobacteria bacterium]